MLPLFCVQGFVKHEKDLKLSTTNFVPLKEMASLLFRHFEGHCSPLSHPKRTENPTYVHFHPLRLGLHARAGMLVPFPSHVASCCSLIPITMKLGDISQGIGAGNHIISWLQFCFTGCAPPFMKRTGFGLGNKDSVYKLLKM